MALVNALSELEDVEDGEKPWCDLVFDITTCETVERDEPGGLVRCIVGQAMADLNGEEIGFGFEMPTQDAWQRFEIPVQGAPPLYASRISLVSIGAPTDRLLHCYEGWFAEPVEGAVPVPSTSHAVARLTCSAVSLSGVTDPYYSAMPCKLTFEADASSAEPAESGPAEADFFGAELYFNVDLTAKKAWLREKDPEYRQYLLGFLSGKWRTVPDVPLQRQ